MHKMKNDLTQEYLKSILHYDSVTGIWTWRVDRGKKVKAGTIAGVVKTNGYLSIGIDGKQYLGHRLAWLYVKGVWPTLFIDHINRIKNDNRWFNFREVTNSQNMRNTDLKINNKTGVKGVRFTGGRYIATARLGEVNVYVGSFDTLKEASDAFESINNQHNFPDFKIASDYILGMML